MIYVRKLLVLLVFPLGRPAENRPEMVASYRAPGVGPSVLNYWAVLSHGALCYTVCLSLDEYV